MGSPTSLTAIGRDEDGFTLVELLVAIAIGLIVLGAAVMVFTAGVRSQLRTDSQSAAVQQARTTMERLVRELRQGSGLVPGTTPTSAQLSFITYVHSTCSGAASSTASLCSVTYACSGGTCTRRVGKADGTAPGPAVKVVTGLSSGNVFTYAPSAAAPTYVTATLRLPTLGGGNAITLSDGAAFRNVSG
jgi:prepilin-type N-terminal cleavage/methylation domain-containing protein